MSAALAPWQQRAYDQAVATLAEGRLGHALLVCGPPQLGQREVAERLAAHLLAAHDPRGAHLLEAGTHPDFHLVTLLPNKEGTKLRTEIVIEQIRELSEKLSLTPQYGGAQVAIVDPADAINVAAANALLTTLEEPRPGRYLWLLASNPARLPATIRSRCQRLEFRLPPRDEALAWLQTQGHRDAVGVAQHHHRAAAGDALARELGAILHLLLGGNVERHAHNASRTVVVTSATSVLVSWRTPAAVAVITTGKIARARSGPPVAASSSAAS